MLNDSKIAAYTAILQEELLLATGCTEPIAVAYCAAKLREVLGGKPEKILAEISGNILKNVKSVVVPNTGGRRGIDAAIAALGVTNMSGMGKVIQSVMGDYKGRVDGKAVSAAVKARLS
jgi:L-cysteine desulfidase